MASAPKKPRETEAKIAVESFAAVERALRRHRAVFLEAVEQTDTYLDTPRRDLLKHDRGLRLRQTRLVRRGRAKPDVRPLLTFKGPRHGRSHFKSRQEVQTRIDDPDALLAALAAVGLRATLMIQKCRRSYRLGRCQVELDELPLIGRFVEIEGPAAAEIHRVRELLGLRDEPIKDHYVNLAPAACRSRVKSRGRPCREIMF